MIFAETQRALVLCLFLSCLAIITHSKLLWDVAVIVDNRIEFLTRNETFPDPIYIEEKFNFYCITYDETTETIYVSDQEESSCIYSIKFEKERFLTSKFICPNNYILDITFDASIRTLFWINSDRWNIMKMQVQLNGEAGTAIPLREVPGKYVRSIAADVCNRRIYWSSFAYRNIQHASYNGGNISSIKPNPVQDLHYISLKIDHTEQKLYWIYHVQLTEYNIERSDLDGNNLEVLLRLKYNVPIYLAIDEDSIYWTDRKNNAIWSYPKHPKKNSYPIKIKLYEGKAKIGGIVARDNRINCVEIPNNRTNVLRSDPSQTIETFHDFELNTDMVESMKTDEYTESSDSKVKNCLYQSFILREVKSSCTCKPGFIGNFCDISLCHNYCLQGECSPNENGLPQCICSESYTGIRCEKNVCAHFCLNDGKCWIENETPFCDCTGKNYTGKRCEIPNSFEKIYNIHHEEKSLNDNMTLCKCTNQTKLEYALPNYIYCHRMLELFIVLCILFIVIIIILCLYMTKKKLWPQIRTRLPLGSVMFTSRSRDNSSDTDETITFDNNNSGINDYENPCFVSNVIESCEASRNITENDDNSDNKLKTDDNGSNIKEMQEEK